MPKMISKNVSIINIPYVISTDLSNDIIEIIREKKLLKPITIFGQDESFEMEIGDFTFNLTKDGKFYDINDERCTREEAELELIRVMVKFLKRVEQKKIDDKKRVESFKIQDHSSIKARTTSKYFTSKDVTSKCTIKSFMEGKNQKKLGTLKLYTDTYTISLIKDKKKPNYYRYVVRLKNGDGKNFKYKMYPKFLNCEMHIQEVKRKFIEEIYKKEIIDGNAKVDFVHTSDPSIRSS
jgi:hypothetical protein